MSSIIYEDFNEQYAYFLVLALILLTLELLILERKPKRIYNILLR
jgi:hypothetical protein